MSYFPAADPDCHTEARCDPVRVRVVPRSRDIGGFEGRRVLPSAKQRMVGPFIFFDQMGPAAFSGGEGLDVRPHPHIGLATVTYLFEGALVHRDSLGSEQVIRPGDINWMSAGRGIVHSERSDAQTRHDGGRLAGVQCWVALPRPVEEGDPAFRHYPGSGMPELEDAGTKLRVLVGSFGGARSPTVTESETLLVDAALPAGARLSIPADNQERALYPVSGRVEVAGEPFDPMQLLVLKPGAPVSVTAREPARLLVLGGEPLDGPRHIWWNFVSSSRERIEQAKEDWRHGRFDPVPGDDEFIPLPD